MTPDDFQSSNTFPFVVHIGRHKTGTTSIQNFLNRNRAHLQTCGIHFPAPLELHANAAVQLMHDQGTPLPPDIAHRFPWLSDPAASPIRALRRGAEESGCRMALVSSEGFCNVQPTFLARHFGPERTTILAYIREQLEYLVSAYAQAIQETKRTYSFAEFEAAEYLDYGAFLEQWGAVYPGRLSIRVYERESLAGGDVREDFLRAIGFGSSEGFLFPKVLSNPSIGGPLLRFKILLNQLSPWPVERLMPATYRRLGLLAAEEERFRAKPHLPPELVAAIRDKYAESNARVVRDHLADRRGIGLFREIDRWQGCADDRLVLEDFSRIMEHFREADPEFHADHHDLLRSEVSRTQVPVTEVSEACEPSAPAAHLLPEDGSCIRAVYYFGSACPMSFWDAFRREEVDAHLSRIVADGFNAIIFLVPVGLVQLRESGDPLYTRFLDDLDFLAGRCRSHRLSYMLRVFYVWDSYPLPIDKARLTWSIYQPDRFPAYRDHLQDLWGRVSEDRSFLFAFTTWEDITPQLTVVIPAAPEARRIEVADCIRLPPDLRDGGGIPATGSVVYGRYVAHIDRLFVETNAALREVFPRLTAEVRVDVTPTPGDGFQLHDLQFGIGRATGIVGTYYAPYMGARNDGGEIDGEAAWQAFLRSQRLPDRDSQLRVFIDQLILRIGQEKFAHFSRIKSEHLPDLLLQRIAEWLPRNGIGYASWSFQDYVLSATSNAAFRLGDAAGWSLEGGARCKSQGIVEMAGTSAIAQRRLTRRVLRPHVHLEITQAASATLAVDLGHGEREIPGVPFEGPGEVRLGPDFFGTDATQFRVVLRSGRCSLSRAFLGWDHHSNGGYAVDWKPGEMSALWRQFNELLAAPQTRLGSVPAPSSAPVRSGPWKRLWRLITR